MKYGSVMTRRRMLQLTGVSTLGLGTLAVTGCGAQEQKAQDAQDAQSEGDETTAQADSSGRVKISVYDPSGSVAITQSFAPRLDSLDDKTIAFVGNSMWEEERTFAEIERLLKEKYPTVTVIGQDNFPRHTQEITVENNGIAEKMQELGVDAAIVGNAG